MSEEGVVVAIQLRPTAAGGRLRRCESVEAVPGRGLRGDRTFELSATPSAKVGPGREVTLIEVEAIEAFVRERGIPLAPEETRRNVVTRGVRLNDLVGRELAVGGTTLRGIKLCEPCGHLEELAGKPLQKGLAGRCGLRAQIVAGGTIRVGDPVRVLAPR